MPDMAMIETSGIDDAEKRLRALGDRSRETVRKMLEAGAEVYADSWRRQIATRGHIRSGDMLGAVAVTNYREGIGGGSVDVYPLGDDRKGIRNASKAYIIHYGRKGGGRSRRSQSRGGRMKKSGDRFATKAEKDAKSAAEAAMQAVLDEAEKE